VHRVNDITNIVNGLTSSDKETSEKAQKMADNYLCDKNDIVTDEHVDIKLKYDRSMINKRPDDVQPEKSSNPVSS